MFIVDERTIESVVVNGSEELVVVVVEVLAIVGDGVKGLKMVEVDT